MTSVNMHTLGGKKNKNQRDSVLSKVTSNAIVTLHLHTQSGGHAECGMLDMSLHDLDHFFVGWSSANAAALICDEGGRRAGFLRRTCVSVSLHGSQLISIRLCDFFAFVCERIAVVRLTQTYMHTLKKLPTTDNFFSSAQPFNRCQPESGATFATRRVQKTTGPSSRRTCINTLHFSRRFFHTWVVLIIY